MLASSHPVRGSILLRPADGAGEPLRLPVTSLAALSVRLPPDSSWEVSAELPGFWVKRRSVTLHSGAGVMHVPLELWPLGTLAGRIQLKDSKLPLPGKLVVKTLARPSALRQAEAPPGVLECPVDGRGVWSCSLPAATYDLALSAQGMAPAYRFGVSLPAGKRTALGSITLEKGGSIAAWVAVEGGALEPEHCRARLARVAASGGSLQAALALERTAVQTTVGRDGALQFTGLAPGTYRLQIEQPGYPSVEVAPVRVDPGAGTVLREPLVLRKPSALAFRVVPPRDWLGHPWRAQVFRTEDRTARPIPLVFDGAADAEGRVALAGQSAGAYRIELLDGLGNQFDLGEHRLEGPEAPEKLLEVHWVEVEGRLRLGGAPLRGSLWFGGRSGATSIRMETDEEGRFQGVLPRAGLWRIEIQATDPAVEAWRREEIRPGRSGRVKLAFDLPDTRVFGRVVDPAGQPVPEADVELEGESFDQLLTTDEAGAFELRGLGEGPLWLGADRRSPRSASGRTLVTVVEGRAIGPIELRLRDAHRLTGVVSSPRGPVAGARVLLLVGSPDGGGGVATTDEEGVFSTDVPQKSPRVVAVVSPPGFALRAYEVSTEAPQLALPVSEAAGRLEVELPHDPEELERENLALAYFQNGIPIPTSVLVQWAYDQGMPIDAEVRKGSIPNVAPGDYRVCFIPRQLSPFLATLAIPGGARCAAGSLAAGATLSLKLTETH